MWTEPPRKILDLEESMEQQQHVSLEMARGDGVHFALFPFAPRFSSLDYTGRWTFSSSRWFGHG